MVIVEGEGTVLGVNLGRPTVTNGEVHESIELTFGVVTGVSQGMGVLDGVHMPKGKRDFRGGMS